MPRRKKQIEEERQEEPILDLITEEDQTMEEPQPPEEIIGEVCSQGYDMEMPVIRRLTVDAKTLCLMLNGGFRPFQKFDQVVFQAESTDYFSVFLAFRAVAPGGSILVAPDLAGMRMFKDCPQQATGKMLKVTKK